MESKLPRPRQGIGGGQLNLNHRDRDMDHWHRCQGTCAETAKLGWRSLRSADRQWQNNRSRATDKAVDPKRSRLDKVIKARLESCEGKGNEPVSHSQSVLDRVMEAEWQRRDRRAQTAKLEPQNQSRGARTESLGSLRIGRGSSGAWRWEDTKWLRQSCGATKVRRLRWCGRNKALKTDSGVTEVTQQHQICSGRSTEQQKQVDQGRNCWDTVEGGKATMAKLQRVTYLRRKTPYFVALWSQ